MENNEKRLFTAQKIADAIHYTPQSVRNAANALGIQHVGKDKKKFLYSEEQAQAIAAHYGKLDLFQKALEPAISKDDVIAELETRLEESKQDIAGKDAEIELLKQQLEESKAESANFQKIVSKQIDSYGEQLKAKDRQIETLLEQNKQLTANVSLLNAADKKEALLTEPSPQTEKKKGLLARLFG